MQAIDKQAKVDFVTTYSPAFAEDLAQTDLEKFAPVDTRKNREHVAKGRQDDQMVAWRTTGAFWGATRTVVGTYSPRTAAKQRYRFDQKLGKLQNGLFELRARVRAGNKALKSKEQVKARYKDLCESLYLAQKSLQNRICDHWQAAENVFSQGSLPNQQTCQTVREKYHHHFT